MQDGVLWTNLTRPEIAAGLADEGFPVSVTVVDQLLETFHLGQRKPQKSKRTPAPLKHWSARRRIGV
jgi:hypothetical protein